MAGRVCQWTIAEGRRPISIAHRREDPSKLCLGFNRAHNALLLPRLAVIEKIRCIAKAVNRVNNAF
jgi:hypothetical protein